MLYSRYGTFKQLTTSFERDTLTLVYRSGLDLVWYGPFVVRQYVQYRDIQRSIISIQLRVWMINVLIDIEQLRRQATSIYS